MDEILEGLIIKGIGGFYYVKVGDTLYECKARGVFRKNSMTPLPGDMVNISVQDEILHKGNVQEILPRKTFLIRPAVANITQMLIVTAAKNPSPDFALLDKLLIYAELKGIKAVICLNKKDLDEESKWRSLFNGYGYAGYEVVDINAKDDKGLEPLYKILERNVTVLAGQSGVGKSTIINRIMKSNVMETGEVSKIERGKHTTRHAELISLDCGGYIVDTPGFSSYELIGVKCNELENCYPEFANHISSCRFRGCSHVSEPDCGVKTAIDDGKICSKRYERYVSFYNYLKQQNEYKR